MRFVTTCLLLAATFTALLALALRQGNLHELRAANLSLHQQLEAATATPPPSPPPAAPASNPVGGLSPQEENELLRLRGQIQPLRRELASLSNHLSTPLPPKRPAGRGIPGELSPAQQVQFQAVRAFSRTENQRGAGALGQALTKYLAQNDHQLPDDLAKVQATADTSLSSELLQSFELMRSGQVSTAEQAYTLVAREKQAQQLSDGNLGRAYLRADGVLVCPSLEPPADWAAWETQAQENTRRRQHPQ